MKILVLVKQTPDTETKIRITANGSAIETDGVKFIANPYDDFAVEEALKIKEKGQAQEVVLLSLGDDKAREPLIKGLAMGADRAILVLNDQLQSADSLVVSKVLAQVIKAEAPGLVLCGKQAIDDDNMHVGPMVAELLQWPHLNVVTKVELNGNKAKVEREVEGGQVEVYETPLPCVLGAHKSLNTPRYTALQGIMKAKKKPFDTKKVADYGLDAAQLIKDQKSVLSGFMPPPEKPAGKILKGDDLDALVDQLVKLLREEAKVI